VYDGAGPGTGRRSSLLGMAFHAATEPEIVDFVMAKLTRGSGGRIVTPNVDILRQAVSEAEAREHLLASTVVVADGAPIVWASRLARQPLPARVPGSDLIWSLSAALAREQRTIYLLGGEAGAAERAAAVLSERFEGIAVAGHACPDFGFENRPDEFAAVCAGVIAAKPDFVFVGLGFPKQERVIARLQPELPSTWFMGCGAAIGFVAGTRRRAPRWMQRSGLEWVHRLGREPFRLAHRYAVRDFPFATRLLLSSALTGRSLRAAPGSTESRVPAPPDVEEQR
jgi:N-acetylglucosaminyldiphosphoundecaprenol N-acetyl-beta-D-mannosaminyltransferase